MSLELNWAWRPKLTCDGQCVTPTAEDVRRLQRHFPAAVYPTQYQSLNWPSGRWPGWPDPRWQHRHQGVDQAVRQKRDGGAGVDNDIYLRWNSHCPDGDAMEVEVAEGGWKPVWADDGDGDHVGADDRGRRAAVEVAGSAAVRDGHQAVGGHPAGGAAQLGDEREGALPEAEDAGVEGSAHPVAPNEDYPQKESLGPS